MIQMFDYHADDLDEQEIDYELGIRGAHLSGSIEVKRRDLRSPLNEDRKNPRNVYFKHRRRDSLYSTEYYHNQRRTTKTCHFAITFQVN